MAACSIDTAVRHSIAAGGSLDRLALLDNFCWCDSNNPLRLGELKDAARACYDYAVAYGTPYISGKDSMFNDFRGYDDEMREIMISIPPTLLISSIGIVADVNRCQTIDFKFAGDLIYLIGATADELGGSEYLAYRGEKSGDSRPGGEVPSVDAEKNIRAYRALEAAIRNELVASAIGIERGGLALALAKSSMAGMLGFDADLAALGSSLRGDILLYSESQGRILVSVNPKERAAFEKAMQGVFCAPIGTVREDGAVRINNEKKALVETTVEALQRSYRDRFRDF